MGEVNQKRTLYMPIVKELSTGKLVGALSSDVLDLENEFMSPKLLQKWVDTKALPALTDHINSVSNYAGGWKNFRLEKRGSKSFLLAEPVFFKSNPNTAHLESMVKEAKELGLPFGISIGAIVKEVSDSLYEGKTATRWDDADLLEASWVAIPANQTAGIMKSLKSFKGLSVDESHKEILKMDEENKKPTENLEEKEVKTEKSEPTPTPNKESSKSKKEEQKAKVEDAKTISIEQAQKMVEEAVSRVEKSFLELKEKSDKELEEKLSDVLVKALEQVEPRRKSIVTKEENILNLNELNYG